MQLRMSLQQQLIFPVETLQLSLNQSRSSLYEARQTKDTAWLVSTNSLGIPSMGVDEYSEKTSDVIRFRRQASYPTDLRLLRSWKFPSAGIPEIIWSAMTCGGGIRRSIGLVAMSCDDSVVVRLLVCMWILRTYVISCGTGMITTVVSTSVLLFRKVVRFQKYPVTA